MMKKTYLWLLASLFVAAFTLTACGSDDDDDDAPVVPSSSVTKADLMGKWTLKADQVTYSSTFTDSKIVWDDQTEIPYTFENGVLKYVDGETNVEQQVFMLYDKTVLVRKYTEKNDDGKTYYEADFAFRDGKTVPAKVEDIQGTWHWYMNGNPEDIRCAMTIKGNNFDLVVVAWSMRYVGTFTYENGYMNCTITKGYSGRSENSEGWGNGFVDPKTATSTQWWELAPSAWLFESGLNMAFIGNGSEAYGVFANLPGLYVKK